MSFFGGIQADRINFSPLLLWLYIARTRSESIVSTIIETSVGPTLININRSICGRKKEVIVHTEGGSRTVDRICPILLRHNKVFGDISGLTST